MCDHQNTGQTGDMKNALDENETSTSSQECDRLEALAEFLSHKPKDCLGVVGDCVNCGHEIVVEIIFRDLPASDNHGQIGCRAPDFNRWPKPAQYTAHFRECYCTGCGIMYQPEILAASN